MRFRSNFLANIFNFLGDALEDFNPAAFRFLSAVLPYLSPIPVAWLTSDSASKFLNFTPTIAFIFVFCLEGMGLWFTSLLVDAIVEWIRSWRNWRTFVPVVLFVLAVGSYVYLLVNLNVTLEQASGVSNPLLSKVITLMCFLPLITGIGNGYGKLKLEQKTSMEKEKVHQEEYNLRLEQERDAQNLRILQENNRKDVEKEQIRARERLEREKLRAESSRKLLESQQKLSGNLPESSEPENLSETFPKDWRKLRKLLNLDDVRMIAHLDAEGVRRIAKKYKVDERTVINWRIYAKTELGE